MEWRFDSKPIGMSDAAVAFEEIVTAAQTFDKRMSAVLNVINPALDGFAALLSYFNQAIPPGVMERKIRSEYRYMRMRDRMVARGNRKRKHNGRWQKMRR